VRLLRHALLASLLLAGMDARAADSEDVPAASPHRFSVYMGAAGMAHLSDVRTQGGVGGGIGLRDTIDERFILQADVHHLLMLGNTVGLRLGAGVQRRGIYQPAALLTLTTLLGDRLVFMTPEHPVPVQHPAMTLGVSVAPLRFSMGKTQLSLLELGVGVGTEFPGLGLSYRVGLVEVGLSL
jgi:hypothetical protein